MSITLSDAFSELPATLKKDLLDSYNSVVKNYIEKKWEPAELNGGKLCEVAYTILRGRADGSFPARSSKPRNMVDACRALESITALDRSTRIQVPRMITALYEIRNNRGVGHAGGDVDPNHMDATAVLAMSKWIIAELVRILHAVQPHEATQLVEGLAERTIETIWTDGNIKRILETKLTWKEKALILLLSETQPIALSNLTKWLEHPNVSRFTRDIVRPAHKERLLEYSESSQLLRLLPPGVAYAEAKLATITSKKNI